MSEFLTSNFFYAPDYKTQCIQLNAQAAKVPRGTIICVKGSAPASGAAASDGTYDVIGAGDGAYAQPYGILLNDAPVSASAQTVDVVVIGELFKEYVNGVYKAAHSDNNIPAPIVDALRCIGIILK